MAYLLRRNGWFFYNRRVPDFVRAYDKRKRIRISLRTQCKRTALKKVTVVNDQTEQYWQSLLDLKQSHSDHRYQRLVQFAKQLGFQYMPALELANQPLHDLTTRIETLMSNKKKHPDMVEAVLGAKEPPQITLSQALNKFWFYTKDQKIHKSADQYRKWKTPRIKAVKNFIKTIDDKVLSDLTHRDLMAFKDWWVSRMDVEGVKADTANKDFTHLKHVIETVSIHEELELDIDKLFRKIYLKEVNKGTRHPYETAFIKDRILNPVTLKNLHDEAQAILKIIAETGARPIEIVNLKHDDIKLDVPVPHIHIRPRKGYTLKTRESARILPLVGNALKAFENYPQGFDEYQGRSEALTATLNKYLTRYDLRPTKKHSLYSLRHSFQNRLNALELPDRIQCQLMGHSYPRPKYGGGASLEHLHDVMMRVGLGD